MQKFSARLKNSWLKVNRSAVWDGIVSGIALCGGGMICSGVFCSTLFFGAVACGQEESSVRFDRQVRPILSDLCFQCHGPDEAERQGGLRLDVAEAALKGGQSGPAIVAGDLQASQLWQRVTTTDPELVMPPSNSGKRLSAQQLSILKEWITLGAPFQEHWAFQRIERPVVPKMEGVNHPIDAFIGERLSSHGLQPAPEAD